MALLKEKYQTRIIIIIVVVVVIVVLRPAENKWAKKKKAQIFMQIKMANFHVNENTKNRFLNANRK